LYILVFRSMWVLQVEIFMGFSLRLCAV
jgi:hypothetical protein